MMHMHTTHMLFSYFEVISLYYWRPLV